MLGTSFFVCIEPHEPQGRANVLAGCNALDLSNELQIVVTRQIAQKEGASINIPRLGGKEMSAPSLWPSIEISPSVGLINPQTARISMVLPEPFIP